MTELVLELTFSEFELLRRSGIECRFIGTGAVNLVNSLVAIPSPSRHEFEYFVAEIEKAILFQESDHGCWSVAKEWREAKPTLLSKIRIGLLKPVGGTDA